MAGSVYGLIGYPLGHSFSGVYFGEKFAREGVDGEYRLWPLERLESRGDLPCVEGLRGFNVTIPYKERVMGLLDEVDEMAREIGAVNVVKVLRDGCLRGYNTDAEGFRRSLESMDGFVSGEHERGLVLGGGGASRAVAYALRGMGIEPTIVSRSGREGTIGYDGLDEGLMRGHTVIVNCTPLGMFPATDGAPAIPYELVDGRHFCHDLVYNPSVTRFMELCAGRGARMKNGGEMLRNQAEEAWKIWCREE